MNKLLTALLIITVIFSCKEAQNQTVREPCAAGAFYPGDSLSLTQLLDNFFNRAIKVDLPGPVLGIIAPHAGYVYSGQVAAQAYIHLKNSKIERVILLSPSHIDYFDGAA